MSYVGKKVVVRTDRAGVFFGTLKEQKANSVVMENVRKLWQWYGACGVEELAVNGTTQPDDCRFTVTVSEMEIADAIQIIPASEEAIKTIEGVKEWKRK
jgi:hypothetical protein